MVERHLTGTNLKIINEPTPIFLLAYPLIKTPVLTQTQKKSHLPLSSGFFRHLAHFDGLGGRAFISWARACLEVFWAVIHFVVGHFAFQVTFWDPDGPWTTRWIIPFSSLASLEPLVRRRPCLVRRCRSAPARVTTKCAKRNPCPGSWFVSRMQR